MCAPCSPSKVRYARPNGHKLNAATKYYGCNVNDSVDKSLKIFFLLRFAPFFSYFVSFSKHWSVRACVCVASGPSHLKSHKNFSSRTQTGKWTKRNRAKLAFIIYIFLFGRGIIARIECAPLKLVFHENMNKYECADVVRPNIFGTWRPHFSVYTHFLCPFRRTHSNDIWP